MARKAKSGDTAYNARRREYRAAQRYLKKAEQSSGATAARNKAIAKTHLQNALDTYDPSQNQKISAPITNLAAQLGVDIQGSRAQYINATSKERQAAIQGSTSALESSLKDPYQRKVAETEALMQNKTIGRRIMGGLVDIWRDVVKKGKSAIENRKAATKAIFDYFKVDNWYEVIDKLMQAAGSELFDMSADEEIYDVVRITLQTKVNNNTLVA